MEIKEQKKELRRHIRKLKNNFTLEEKTEFSLPVFETVERLQEFEKAKCVLAYWSMEDEVYTHDFINRWYNDKIILLPCVTGDDLILRRYEGAESMIAGEQFGILEPVGEVFKDYYSIDLMIIPGVAFDKQRNRMGRGRGFYDRLLSVCGCEKIGVCFDFQIVENVPCEEFDVKMDKILATSQVY